MWKQLCPIRLGLVNRQADQLIDGFGGVDLGLQKSLIGDIEIRQKRFTGNGMVGGLQHWRKKGLFRPLGGEHGGRWTIMPAQTLIVSCWHYSLDN